LTTGKNAAGATGCDKKCPANTYFSAAAVCSGKAKTLEICLACENGATSLAFDVVGLSKDMNNCDWRSFLMFFMVSCFFYALF
jgi:hypothetical protein